MFFFFAREREVCVLRVARVKLLRTFACVFGKWYEGFCEATLRCAAVAALRSSSKRELLLKAAELLETRIKIFGDAFFEKAFPSVLSAAAAAALWRRGGVEGRISVCVRVLRA